MIHLTRTNGMKQKNMRLSDVMLYQFCIVKNAVVRKTNDPLLVLHHGVQARNQGNCTAHFFQVQHMPDTKQLFICSNQLTCNKNNFIFSLHAEFMLTNILRKQNVKSIML